MQDLTKLAHLGAEKRWAEHNSEIQQFLSNNNLIEEHPSELSILCGFLAGDGAFDHRYPHYEIRFYPDNKTVAKKYTEIFQKLYGKKLKIKKKRHLYGDCYIVSANSKKAYMHLTSIAKFGGLKWEIPEFVLKKDELKRAWLRAFFDCEAHVNNQKGNIHVNSVNEDGLNQVKESLESLGIASRIYTYVRKNKNWNTNFILVVSHKNIDKFYDIIGFTHSKKLKKLSGIINTSRNGRAEMR